MIGRAGLALAFGLAIGGAGAGAAPLVPAPAEGSVRVAAFNASLSRKGAGMAWRALAEGKDRQVRAVADIIRAVRPDVLLVLELDHDREGLALGALQALLRTDGGAGPGIDYPHAFAGPVNTGAPSGRDLDGDGEIAGPRDAYGFGLFPGQYGMAVLSRLPLDIPALRSFQMLRWAQMPDALLPRAFYGDAADVLRLSSKSHWDLPVILPDGTRLHLLASHPTPPVFDGPEDRNGRRNHDEIRFWTDYLSGADWMTDDAGRRGGLEPQAPFVVLGDLNADPRDGDGRLGAVVGLLAHPRVSDPGARSAGAVAAAAAQGGANARHRGDPARDTADWADGARGPGNLRVDYALPSADLTVTGGGVFWPAPGAPGADLVGGGRRATSSDHRLIWVDIRP
jgi:endonuclease/exonuclease/phosphatase family metal-dependent hydrolase